MQETNRHSGPGACRQTDRCGGTFASSAILSLLFSIWVSSGSPGASFSGGTGEPNDPYQIATAGQLISVGSDPALLSKHFVLTADIDLDPNLPGGQVFPQALIAPSSEAPFAGSLDGSGHVIRNLTVNSDAGIEGGLFRYVAEAAVVKNLGLEHVTLECLGGSIGGLAAQNDGTLLQCRLTGSAKGFYGVGGLVADNRGTLALCCSTCSVVGYDTMGGLVSVNSGTITECHSDGNVTGDETDIGGLVGGNDGQVYSCYASGNVTGFLDVGGLVGDNDSFGSIVSCYATGDVSAQEVCGGLVGELASGPVISSYATGTATAGLGVSVGGLAGDGGDVRDSYFLANPSYAKQYDGGKGLTGEQMTQQGSFAGFDFWGTQADGLNDEWFMSKDSAPILVWQTDRTGLLAIPDVAGLVPEEAEKALSHAGFVLGSATQAEHSRSVPRGCVVRTYPPSYTAPGSAVDLILSLGPDDYDWSTNPGDGTAGRPYQIRTARELDNLGYHPELWGMHFMLVADVDLAGRVYSTALIAPDQDGSQEGFQGTAFAGSLDGRGFKIMNLHIVTRTHDYLGLFGSIAEGGVVTRINLEDVQIKGGTGSVGSPNSAGTGSDYVGTVAGYNAGTISACSVSGVISGHANVDKVAGAGPGVIQDYQSTVMVPKKPSWSVF